MVDQASGSDDQRTALMTRIVANFDQADTDSDGKVSFTEARAFTRTVPQARRPPRPQPPRPTDDSSAVLANILQLLLAYGGLDDTTDQQSTALRRPRERDGPPRARTPGARREPVQRAGGRGTV
jgi:hypothetical protein